MALITTHATLKTAVAEWINRADLNTTGAGIDLMIDNAENRLARDPRVRNLTTAAYSITADDLAVPAGFDRVESWYLNTSVYKHEIEIVPADALPRMFHLYGFGTGVPRVAARVGSTFKFAPPPDATYASVLVYWQTLTALSAGSNWLVAAHPDIYLYATLCEAAPYLIEDERLPIWEAELEHRLESLNVKTETDLWGGSVRKRFTPIG